MSDFLTGFCVGGTVLSLLIGVIVPSSWTRMYREGQIDALTGKVLFELVEQPTGETQWERKK